MLRKACCYSLNMGNIFWKVVETSGGKEVTVHTLLKVTPCFQTLLHLCFCVPWAYQPLPHNTIARMLSPWATESGRKSMETQAQEIFPPSEVSINQEFCHSDEVWPHLQPSCLCLPTLGITDMYHLVQSAKSFSCFVFETGSHVTQTGFMIMAKASLDFLHASTY